MSSISRIVKKKVSAGITWIGIEEAGLSLCCGCPADTVKHLKIAGIIKPAIVGGVSSELGPNAILLSDTLIQNGQIANLAEFPILQMMYLQGMNLPGHPNFQKKKPLLIGYGDQIDSQLAYVTIGNHGLSTIGEIMEAGISEKNARKIFQTKLHYAGGKMITMNDLVDTKVLEDSKIEVGQGVFIQRIDVNQFLISFKNEVTKVDLGLGTDEHFLAPYHLPYLDYSPNFFSVTHTGEGNGWDPQRPCMASVIHHNGRTYLVDAGPNILNNLARLGIGLSEIDGIFLSHVHDDHFAGITELLNVERKLDFYATRLIRATAEGKLRALTNSELDLLHIAFVCKDLKFNEWNDIEGLEVKPVYSPHTVETSTFNFRVEENGSYRTYTHLSDTINLTEFKKIVENSPLVFTQNDEDLIKKSYLSTVNLKKIDVGGGAIHGHLSDYLSDKSELCVMAHTSSKQHYDQENFINVDFGDTHDLIVKMGYSFSQIKALKYLGQYFEGLDQAEISELSGYQVHDFQPGEVLLSEREVDKVVLILSGVVKCVGGLKKTPTLDAGNFIGFSKKYFVGQLPEKYVTKSRVKCFIYEEATIERFISKFRLKKELQKRIRLAEVLRYSTLFQNSISNSIYNRIGKHARSIDAGTWKFDENTLRDYVYIIKRGETMVDFGKGQLVFLSEYDHFGGLSLLSDQRRVQNFRIDDSLEAVAIPIECIENVPILIWRMIELEENRYLMTIFTAK